VSQKSIPNIIDYNSKHDEQILIIFGKNISDTAGRQTKVEVPTSPIMCFCTAWGKRNSRNGRSVVCVNCRRLSAVGVCVDARWCFCPVSCL